MSNANEPAFPTSVQRGQNGEYWTEQEGGLTKREYFAAMAMQGYLAMYAGPDIAAPAAKAVALACVDYADTLLAELAKSRFHERTWRT